MRRRDSGVNGLGAPKTARQVALFADKQTSLKKSKRIREQRQKLSCATNKKAARDHVFPPLKLCFGIGPDGCELVARLVDQTVILRPVHHAPELFANFFDQVIICAGSHR